MKQIREAEKIRKCEEQTGTRSIFRVFKDKSLRTEKKKLNQAKETLQVTCSQTCAQMKNKFFHYSVSF